jgi:5-(carboxyamino)imidazole ribonucleotide mutase
MNIVALHWRFPMPTDDSIATHAVAANEAMQALARLTREMTDPNDMELLVGTLAGTMRSLRDVLRSEGGRIRALIQVAGEALQEAGIRYEVRVMSAHRDPDTVAEYCKAARMRGLRVIIAGAGMSAALPGVAAANTDLPVIGVPVAAGALNGIDALLTIAQMPPGVPVGCVAIDGAKNAGLLAARIINS